MRGTKRVAVLLVAGLAAFPASSARAAGEVRFFEMASQAEFLEGTLEGIAIDRLGKLSLAEHVDRLAEIGEPFLLSVARHPRGWVVGTGNGGKVVLVGDDGSIQTLFVAPEPEIFAVWADDHGTVYAGSSPNGGVYRIRDGAGEDLFSPGETYIWDIEGAADGSLLVATGTSGKLFRVGPDGGGEVLFDSADTHLRTIKILADGDVLVGTAGDGLVLRLSEGGRKVRTLHDAEQPEVVAFAEGEDGACYAAVLASEASWVDLTKQQLPPAGPAPGAAANTGEESGSGGGEVRVTVTSQGEPHGGPAVGTRPSGFQGPRSEILRIGAEGTVDSVARFKAETVYALHWSHDRLWIGTGLEGKVFGLRGTTLVLEKDLDERQVVAVLGGASGPVYATTNSAALFATSGRPERVGTYLGPVLDAEAVADFGTLRWVGARPKGTEIRFSYRSGMSSRPDRTWSAWSGGEARAGGSELSLAVVPPGRYLQWRAELTSANGDSPDLSRVTVSYRQQNLRPRIKSLEVLSPGEVIAPPGGAGSTTFEPSRPDRNGIFTPLKASSPSRERKGKTLWKRGYRTLSWEAEDPNKDDLRYRLFFRRDEDGASWLLMEDDLEASYWSFDATALPDGVYRFKLEVADRAAKDLEPALSAEQVSEPVIVDHTPPTLGKVSTDTGTFTVQVLDAANPLIEALYSMDAEAWLPAPAADGLLDGVRETVLLPIRSLTPEMVLLRVTDAAHNVVTFDLSRHLP